MVKNHFRYEHQWAPAAVFRAVLSGSEEYRDAGVDVDTTAPASQQAPQQAERCLQNPVVLPVVSGSLPYGVQDTSLRGVWKYLDVCV